MEKRVLENATRCMGVLRDPSASRIRTQVISGECPRSVPMPMTGGGSRENSPIPATDPLPPG
ncbi:hypothetical protein E2C01_077348 [Portunus trituberculatus]|uniref:Uncharacterized protein n=1 Tax=Portunus trituberculatus TaxID=210409 RepID=A0A5B7IL66_PORTR|nr:hypothetical protein [Portunus trituberculatus]